MHTYKKQGLFWIVVGTLIGMIIALVAVCCFREGQPVAPPPACIDAGAPHVDVFSAPDAGGCLDAADASDAAPAVGGDAGPSCGSHPWCRHPKECCWTESDRCA